MSGSRRITVNGQEFNSPAGWVDGVEWEITDVNGLGDPANTFASEQLVGQDGAWATTGFRAPRAVGLQGIIRATDEVRAELAVDRLRALIGLAEFPVTLHYLSGDRTVWVRRDGEVQIESREMPTEFRWSAVMKAVDPAIYAGDATGSGDLVLTTGLPMQSGALVFAPAPELRRNHARDPRGASPAAQGVGRWTQSSGVGTYTNETGISGPAGLGITTCKRVTLVSSASDSYGWHIIAATNSATPSPAEMLPVTPGEPITLSLYVRWTTVGVAAITGTLQVRYSADGATWQAAAITAATPSIAKGSWVRVAATVTVPADAQYMAVRFFSTGPSDRASGDFLDGTALLIERSASLAAYMDGTYSPDASLPAWTGAVNDSASILTGDSGIVFPITFTGTSATGDLVVDLSAGGRLQLRIDGLVNQPQVVVENQLGQFRLAWYAAIAAGMWLDVDPVRRSALLQGQASRPPNVRRWPKLAAGLNTIRFRAADYSASALLTATIRPTL